MRLLLQQLRPREIWLLICQSYKPGHNVHWIQFRQFDRPTSIEVTYSTPDGLATDAGGVVFQIERAPKGLRSRFGRAFEKETFHLHNATALCDLIDDRGPSFAFDERAGLLAVTGRNWVGEIVFNPAFEEFDACAFHGEESPLRATVTQIVVDGFLGSLDPAAIL